MVFSDLFFLFAFLPSFAICYMLASRSIAWKNAVLTIFSLIFYAWGEPAYVFLMLLCVVANYFVGLQIDGCDGRRRKYSLALGVAFNIALLGVFKYAGFFAEILCSLGIPVPVPHIALPIGISFYIFQSISYLVDVYRREAPVQKRFASLLLYISMFPQLIAGPIVRYGTIANEINNRHVSAADLSEGIYRFIIGLGKKVVLANQLSEISTQFLADGLGSLTTSGAWIGVVAFALQIYFDFSGYSDMAIGLGRCLGFHFNENFRHPYCCNSITDFWRRWHISLGSFFRDYVYIPLGGNRRHQALNILVVWFLTGMWHGASWNFVLWGLYFGLFVMVEKYTLLKVIERIPRVLLHVYSLLVVMVGWGIFYFDNLTDMGRFFKSFFGMAGIHYDGISQSALSNNFWLWIVAIVFCVPIPHRSRPVRLVLSIVLLVLSVALLVGATNNAFIYTRF